MNENREDKKTGFAGVADIIRTIIPREKFDEVEALNALSSSWETVIPAAVSAAVPRTRPLSINGRILTVAVDNPLWSGELGFFRKEIVAKIRQLVPSTGIEDVKFVTKAPRRAS